LFDAPPAGGAAVAGGPTLADEVAALVNRVYDEAERGLWRDGATRTDAEEVEALLEAGELAGLRRDGRLAGVVRIRLLDDETGEFGMLAADPALRGQGIGRDLVAYAEAEVLATGRRIMQLELLVPREGTLASKEFLHAWYTRRGYEQVGLGAIEDQHPALAPMLAVPTDYRIYRKSLA
jgi:ribosomal protein S18 acetylase RimI-like enzyme